MKVVYNLSLHVKNTINCKCKQELFPLTSFWFNSTLSCKQVILKLPFLQNQQDKLNNQIVKMNCWKIHYIVKYIRVIKKRQFPFPFLINISWRFYTCKLTGQTQVTSLQLVSYGAFLFRRPSPVVPVFSDSSDLFRSFMLDFSRSKVHLQDLQVCCDWSTLLTPHLSRPLLGTINLMTDENSF